MRYVKELTKELVPLLDSFLHRDPLGNAYAIWDLGHSPQRSKFFLLFDEGELVGVLLDYLTYGGFHSIWLFGEDIDELLDIELPDKLVFHVPMELEEKVRERFPIRAGFSMEFMILRRGQERLCQKHEVRPLGLEDARSLAGLRGDAKEEEVRKAEAMLREQPFYGIFSGSELASVACFQAMNPEIWILGGFYTKPEYRNRGYASSLASFLVKQALSRVEHVGLYVRADNRPAKHVYEKVGFRVYRRMRWLDYNTGFKP